jgi:hypothetical protein
VELGDPIARGRDADVYRLDGGRVLRRYRRPGPTDRERRMMAAAVGQRLFAAAFLAGFDRRQVFRYLPVVVAARLADPAVRDHERRRLRRLTTGRRK